MPSATTQKGRWRRLALVNVGVTAVTYQVRIGAGMRIPFPKATLGAMVTKKDGASE